MLKRSHLNCFCNEVKGVDTSQFNDDSTCYSICILYTQSLIHTTGCFYLLTYLGACANLRMLNMIRCLPKALVTKVLYQRMIDMGQNVTRVRAIVKTNE